MKKIIIITLFVMLLTGCTSKCDEGYKYNKDNKTCSKTESIEANVSYECTGGYTQVDDKCHKEEVKEATTTYTCNNGYTLSEDKKTCYKYNYVKPTTVATCYDGFHFSDTTKTNCRKWIYQSPQPQLITNTTETCPTGYTKDTSVSTSKCSKLLSSAPTDSLGLCPNTPSNSQATTVHNGTCYFYLLDNINKNTTYSMTCFGGYFFNSDLKACVTFERHDPFNKSKCNSGVLNSNNMCETKSTINSTVTYSCVEESQLVNNKCITNIDIDIPAVHSCNEGYQLKDNMCIKEIIQKK